MENYLALYRIRILHDYFDGRPCGALMCRLTSRGAELARRRGLFLRQTAPDEWTLFFGREPDTTCDVLDMELCIVDERFALYTAWEGFRPCAAFGLELPAASETVEAASALRPTGVKRAIGSGFCSLSLRLSEQVVRAAQHGRPIQTVLHFEAAAAQWEFLFFRQSRIGDLPGQLLLEDTTGRLQFTPFEACKVYGREGWITRSVGPIALCAAYPCRLRLSVQNGGTQKRVLRSQVDPPEPGRLMDVPKGILRQICYF